MAAGDRTIKVQEIHIARGGGTITYSASYQFFVEDSAGVKCYCSGGSIEGNFGTPAAFAAMTGLQMNNAVIAQVQAKQGDGSVPSGTVS